MFLSEERIWRCLGHTTYITIEPPSMSFHTRVGGACQNVRLSSIFSLYATLKIKSCALFSVAKCVVLALENWKNKPKISFTNLKTVIIPKFTTPFQSNINSVEYSVFWFCSIVWKLWQLFSCGCLSTVNEILKQILENVSTSSVCDQDYTALRKVNKTSFLHQSSLLGQSSFSSRLLENTWMLNLFHIYGGTAAFPLNYRAPLGETSVYLR